MEKKCTCNFSKETADEIGHYEGCPLYGEKTLWQKKQLKDKFNRTVYCKTSKNRNQCDKKCVVYKVCKIKK